LAVIVPAVTKSPREDVRGAERLLRALERGEIRWVFAREQKPGFTIARAALEDGLAGRLTLLPVDAELAIASAAYRGRYYSRSNAFSSNDGIFLATAVRSQAAVLFTTDPHLLQVSEVAARRPGAFPSERGGLQR
jgi:predicted nucleic acid-binding protein